MRVLLVEDHPDIAENIGDFLGEAGHEVDFALDGATGLRLAQSETYDAIVLDLTLPRLDGLEICRRLRRDAKRRVPVLMLTARDALADKLEGFDAGTDDYLVKPFALEELHARLKALAGRRNSGPPHLLRVADLELDLESRRVSRGDRVLALGPTGFELLRMLMEASPAVVSREQLSQRLWGDAPPRSDALRSHVYALRQEVDKPFAEKRIETVHGVGFRLRDGEDAGPPEELPA